MLSVSGMTLCRKTLDLGSELRIAIDDIIALLEHANAISCVNLELEGMLEVASFASVASEKIGNITRDAAEVVGIVLCRKTDGNKTRAALDCMTRLVAETRQVFAMLQTRVNVLDDQIHAYLLM